MAKIEAWLNLKFYITYGLEFGFNLKETVYILWTVFR